MRAVAACSRQGIGVTCPCPNAVNTGMLGRDEDHEARVRGAVGPERWRLGNVVEPDECAAQTVAAIDESRFRVLAHARWATASGAKPRTTTPAGRDQPNPATDAARGLLIRGRTRTQKQVKVLP